MAQGQGSGQVCSSGRPRRPPHQTKREEPIARGLDQPNGSRQRLLLGFQRFHAAREGGSDGVPPAPCPVAAPPDRCPRPRGPSTAVRLGAPPPSRSPLPRRSCPSPSRGRPSVHRPAHGTLRPALGRCGGRSRLLPQAWADHRVPCRQASTRPDPGRQDARRLCAGARRPFPTAPCRDVAAPPAHPAAPVAASTQRWCARIPAPRCCP